MLLLQVIKSLRILYNVRRRTQKKRIPNIIRLLSFELHLFRAKGCFRKYLNLKTYRRFTQMNISRSLGTLVVFAVPAIIGGGIVYAFFGDYVPVFVFETLLLLVAGGFACK